MAKITLTNEPDQNYVIGLDIASANSKDKSVGVIMNKFNFCLKYADKWQENGKWFVSNEFICGTFAGRCFEGNTLEEAIQKLIDYFDSEIQYEKDTIVKNCLYKVGWSKDVDYINENIFIIDETY